MTYCGGFRMTRHASERQAEMRVPSTELAACLRDPEQVYEQTGKYAGCEMRQRGRIAAVTKAGAVLTVLWRTADVYQRKEAAS